VAVAHSILVITWHLLTNDADYNRPRWGLLHPPHRQHPTRRDKLVHDLELMGYTVTVTKAA